MRSNGTLSDPEFYGTVHSKVCTEEGRLLSTSKTTVESLAVSRYEEVRAALFLPGQWSQKTNWRNLQFLGTRQHTLSSKSLEGPGDQVVLHEPRTAWLQGNVFHDGRQASVAALVIRRSS